MGVDDKGPGLRGEGANARRSRLRARRLLLVTLLVLTSPVARPVAAEPMLQLKTSRAPHYVGVPVDVHVHGTELAAEPEPTCEAEPVASGTLELVGIVPQISSSVQIVNGRVYKEESATYTCQYQFTASEAGPHQLGPFRIVQAGTSLETQPLALRIQTVPVDPKLRIRVLVPEKPVYIGQHLPVTIEWWLDEDLKDRIAGYRIRSELFDRDDTFRFLEDEPPGQSEQSLDITTASGERRLEARVEVQTAGGRRYLVLRAERTLVPLRAGTFELAPATVDVDEVTGWRRDLFGGRRPADTKRIFSRDEDRVLVVKAAPSEGRPDSFGGAVGRGFTIDVAADRSVVQQGDPITLTVTIHGDGNLASAGLPPFDVDGGLSPEHFRLPEGDVPGVILDDAKVFRVSLRVLDEGVREIPALAYSYFDPELGEYRTAHSRPIALSVGSARVISAEDVMGSAARPESPVAEDEPEVPDEQRASRGSFTLTGADLSIERDPAVLLRTSGGGAAVQAAAYAGSIAVLLGAVWLRRRDEVSPEVRRRRDVFAAQSKRIAAASSLPRREAAAEIAAALREIVAAAPALRSHACVALIAGCDEVIYAPGDGDAQDGAFDPLSGAKALLDEMKAGLG